MSMRKPLALAAARRARARLGRGARRRRARISASRSAKADITAWDITILPDGTNLPPGSGTAAQGAKIFVEKGCTPATARTARAARSSALVGNPPLTGDGIDGDKTIANFWAYATTLFDYIRRAMPWPTPRTLTDEEVYALVRLSPRGQQAHRRERRDERADLPKVKMPNRDNFIIKFPDRI